MTKLSPCPKQTPVKSQTGKYTRVRLQHEGKQSAGLTMPSKSVFKGMKKKCKYIYYFYYDTVMVFLRKTLASDNIFLTGCCWLIMWMWWHSGTTMTKVLIPSVFKWDPVSYCVHSKWVHWKKLKQLVCINMLKGWKNKKMNNLIYYCI